MRVIAGLAKGLRLKTVKGEVTRPTSDRVRESLFSILAPVLEGVSVLDLFAGSGALGIEALSRGAKDAVFVDKSFQAIEILKENLEHTRLISRSTIIRNDYLKGIQTCQQKGLIFDLIFLDPPYNTGLAQLALNAITQSSLLKIYGRVVVEHHVKEEIQLEPKNFILIRVVDYGETRITIYQNMSKKMAENEV